MTFIIHLIQNILIIAYL